MMPAVIKIYSQHCRILEGIEMCQEVICLMAFSLFLVPPIPPPKGASPPQLSRKFPPAGILKKPGYGPPPSPSSSFESTRIAQTNSMPRNMPPPSPDSIASQPIDPRHHQYRPMASSQSNSGSFVSLNEAAVNENFIFKIIIIFDQFNLLASK